MSLHEYLPKDDMFRLMWWMTTCVAIILILWLTWSYATDVIAMNYGYQQETVERPDPNNNAVRRIYVIWRKASPAEEKK